MKEVVVAKAVWCGPCKAYGPTVVSAKEEIEKMGYELRFVDVDENPEFCQKHGIRGVPSTIIINGDKTSVFSGNVSKEELLERINNHSK